MTTAHGRLMLTVLGGLVEFERELISARTGEDHTCAKAWGKSLGRPFKISAHQRQEALARREGGELLNEIARSYAVNSSTISRRSAWRTILNKSCGDAIYVLYGGEPNLCGYRSFFE
jgi:DNA invertase Pin-like site-specific DNA recombinase